MYRPIQSINDVRKPGPSKSSTNTVFHKSLASESYSQLLGDCVLQRHGNICYSMALHLLTVTRSAASLDSQGHCGSCVSFLPETRETNGNVILYLPVRVFHSSPSLLNSPSSFHAPSIPRNHSLSVVLGCMDHFQLQPIKETRFKSKQRRRCHMNNSVSIPV